MKKFTILFLTSFLLSIPAVFSQRPVIALTFTAEYNNLHVPLDSIYIQNLTQTGDTMLFAPDTVLFLDYVSGIPDYSGTAKSSFSVSPNYPNPSVDGKTSIDIFIPATEIVTMRVFDIIGNEVAFFENTLDAGNHHFTFLAGKEKYYVLSVNYGNEVRSVKMINSGNSPQNQGRLIYEGSSEREPSFKSQKEITGFGFSLGDQLRFIGYAKSPMGFAGSDAIEATPEGSENYVFEILEGLPCPGIPTVSYEGLSYTTVLIGDQCWFKENLAYLPNVSPSANGSGTVPYYYVYDYQGTNVTEAKATTNYQTYGVLYNWPASLTACPTGWHLPTDSEWTTLTTFLGGQNVAGGKMKETGTTHWTSPNTDATNSSGFTGLPGGYRENDGAFYNLGNNGDWWSSTEYSTTYAWFRVLDYDYANVGRGNYYKSDGFSVRCLRDGNSPTLPIINTAPITNITQTTATSGGEVTDDGGTAVTERGICWSTSQNPTLADNHTTDGPGTGTFVSNLTGLTFLTTYYLRAYATNSVGTAYGNEVSFTTLAGGFTCGDMLSYEGINYNTLQIGTQCWFKENLAYLPNVSPSSIGSGTVPYYYVYDYEGTNVTEAKATTNYQTYGVLYNWPASLTACPTGWHLPTDSEWTILTTFLGGESVAGGKMKETGTVHWNPPNTGATNSSGFTGLPGGCRLGYGYFTNISNDGKWLSSTETSATGAWNRSLTCSSAYVYRTYNLKSDGISVRCLRDGNSPTLPTVTTASITNITQTTATSGGNVTSDGGATVTARGVCWSISQNPTMADSHTSDGTGTGTFVSNLTGLTANTPYFVRAYATNNVGTAYGNEVNFTTLSAGFVCGTTITINHVTGEVAPVDKTVTYGTVTNIPGETSKCWITSNLGADHQATAKDDATEPSAGWYWQFNRMQGFKHDGTIRTPNSVWISSINENSNWLPANDPCTIELGSGWRIPTKTEWTNVEASGNWTNWNGPWNSALKMHAAGDLDATNGSLSQRGSFGAYWSSTQADGSDGFAECFSSGLIVVSMEYKPTGFSLRCIKE